MQVKVCLPNNKIVMVEGEVYGCVTVAPILRHNLVPSNRVFVVRSLKYGVRIAAYVDKRVAQNFARRIDAQFGDRLPKAFDGNWNYAEDAEDKALLDYLDELADHPARWWKECQQMKFRKAVQP